MEQSPDQGESATPAVSRVGAEGGPISSVLFVGGGEMAARIRAKDWSDTPVGPIEEWPGNLCAAASIMLESRQSMLIFWGTEFTTFYNDAFMELAGSKHPAGLGSHGWEMFGEIWPTVGPMLRGVLDTGVATWVDDQMLMMNRRGLDEETYWTYSYSPIRDVDGRVDGVFTATTDTTARVVGERRLRTLGELGEIAAVELATVEDVVAGAVRVVARNRDDVPCAAAYVLGEESRTAHLVGSFGLNDGLAAQVSLPDPQPGDVWDTEIWEAVSSGQPVLTRGVDQDAYLPATDGLGPAPPQAAMALPLVATGQVTGLLVLGVSPYRPLDDDYRSFFDLVATQVSTVVADVLAYQTQRQRAEELAELDRAKTAFFTNISHEFRTPLTLIMGPLEELRSVPAVAADPRSRENVEVVHRNGLRLSRLVDSLLDFSRIQEGRLTASYEPIDLCSFTLELVSLFRSAVERAGLTLELDCPSLGRQVYLDQGMWEKIVLNLLSNALKFTFSGGITVSLRAEDEAAVLRVSDTGTGVAAADLPRLFDRFYRGDHDQARSVEGSGIGLALVRELVELHGGTITAESALGGGTTFTVALPFGRDHLPAERVRRSAEVVAVPSGRSESFVAEAQRWVSPIDSGIADTVSPGGGALPAAGTSEDVGGRVLVADDNADMREYLQRLLASRYQVEAVGDGMAALAAARVRPPDLVISDVMMPAMDGLALVAALRGDASTAKIPVLLLSARAGQEASVEGFDVGADDYLVKPFSARELLARVRSNLDMARLRTQESTWRATLIGALQDGMYVADAHGVIVEVNDAFAEIVGYGREGLPYPIPHPWWPDPEDEPEEYAQIEQAVNGAIRGATSGRVVLPMRHGADRSRIWVSVSWSAVTRPDGSRQALVGTVRDVTAEYREAHRDAAVAKLTARLAEASDVSGVLSAGLAEWEANWAPARTTLLTWDGTNEVSVTGFHTTWAALPPEARAQIIQIRNTGQTRRHAGDRVTGRPTTAGAQIRAGTQVSVVWLEIAPGRPFGSDDAELLSDLAGHLGQALTRARLFDEQRTASLTLQHAILGPTRLPAGFAVRYEPAVSHLAVGGDWYDVVELDDQQVGIAVGDCVGHGLGAAAVMGQLRTACRTLLLDGHTAAQVLTAMDHVAALNPDAYCTTLFCATIDRTIGTIRYSRAGHPPAILVRADGRTELLDGARGVPLASFDVGRSEATTSLAPGDTLLLYTDGLVERRGSTLDAGIDKARDLLSRTHRLTPGEIADSIAEHLLGDDHHDDVAYLIYQHPLSAGSSVTTTIPAQPDQLATLRHTLRRWLAASGVEECITHELVLAVGEAASNAVEHAYLDSDPGSIALTLDHRADELYLMVRDHGRWRTDRAPGPRGRGLEIIEKLTDAAVVESDEQGTVVRLRKKLPL